MIVRALSLQQPFANWVATGRKSIETRKWTVSHRGDILICASQSGMGEPKGVALCLVELYAIRPMVASDAKAACVDLYPRANAWLLRNRRVLREPFPIKGSLGLFRLEIDPDTLAFLK